MLFLKLLKVVLPVATVTSAAVATTLLVSSSSDIVKEKDLNIDEEINDFQRPSEDFQDKKIYYAEGGNAEGLTSLGDDLSPSVLEALEKNDQTPPSNEPVDKELLKQLASDPNLRVEDKTELRNNGQSENKEISLSSPEDDGALKLPVQDPENAEDSSTQDNVLGNPETDLTELSPKVAGDTESEKELDSPEASEPSEKAVDSEARVEEEQGQPSTSGVEDNGTIEEADESLVEQQDQEVGGISSPRKQDEDSSDNVAGDGGVKEFTEEQIRKMLEIKQQSEDLIDSLGKLII